MSQKTVKFPKTFLEDLSHLNHRRSRRPTQKILEHYIKLRGILSIGRTLGELDAGSLSYGS